MYEVLLCHRRQATSRLEVREVAVICVEVALVVGDTAHAPGAVLRRQAGSCPRRLLLQSLVGDPACTAAPDFRRSGVAPCTVAPGVRRSGVAPCTAAPGVRRSGVAPCTAAPAVRRCGKKPTDLYDALP